MMNVLNPLILSSLSLVGFLSTTSSTVADPLEYSLDFKKWELIALPAYLPEDMNTPMAVFGDEMLAAKSDSLYGRDWEMFAYDSSINDYESLEADEPIDTEKGYWIIQAVDRQITVRLPDASVAANGSHADMLAAELGCAPGQIIQGAETTAWECVDQAPASCPTRFTHMVMAAYDTAPIVEGADGYFDGNDAPEACILSVWRDTPGFGIYDFYLNIPVPGLEDRIPSWGATRTVGSYSRSYGSSEENTVTVEEILACTELHNICHSIRESLDPGYADR